MLSKVVHHSLGTDLTNDELIRSKIFVEQHVAVVKNKKPAMKKPQVNQDIFENL